MSGGVAIPVWFSEGICRREGRRGARWLRQLRRELPDALARFDLEGCQVLSGGTVSLCTSAIVRTTGDQVVLKIAPPWGDVRQEIAALRAWDGRGAARLLEADGERGWLVLEQVLPGSSPPAAAERSNCRQIGKLLADLAAAAAPAGTVGFERELERRFRLAYKRTDLYELPLETSALLERVELDAVLLCDSTEERVFLHGDLWERNVLTCARRGFVAVDPRPCLGERAFDSALWAVTSPQAAGGVAARLYRLARANCGSYERLVSWSWIWANLFVVSAHENADKLAHYTATLAELDALRPALHSAPSDLSGETVPLGLVAV